jgi:aspartate 1-decarboxylase
VIRNLARSIIHNATVTHAEADWPVSLRLDPALMRAAELLPLEEVEIVNVVTAERYRTFVVPGEQGEVRVHAAAEHHVRAGDTISILAFGQLHAGQTLDHRAKIVTLGGTNQIVTISDATTQF